MLKKLLVSAAIAGLSAGAALADNIVTVSWSGKVSSGTDTFGTFGGGDMSGADFTSTYVFNLTQANYQLGTLTMGSLVYPFFSTYSGGPVSASFTINGHTASAMGSSGSYLGAHRDPDQMFGPSNQSQFDTQAQGMVGNIATVLFQRIQQSGLDESWADLAIADFDGDVSDSVSAASSNWFAVIDYSTFDYYQLFLNNQHLTITNSVVAGPSPTPEPASWAMMIVGFGAVGAGLRRRTRIRYA